jgi:hypothetical protein
MEERTVYTFVGTQDRQGGALYSSVGTRAGDEQICCFELGGAWSSELMEVHGRRGKQSHLVFGDERRAGSSGIGSCTTRT